MRSKTFTHYQVGILFLFLFFGFKTQTYSQATNASISGQVKDENGEPLIGAALLIKNELTGFTASAITNLTGNYTVNQLPLANDYSVTCSYLGYGSKVFTGYAVRQGDRIKLDIVLSEEAQSLSEVRVVSDSLTNSIDRFGSSPAVTAEAMSTLPSNCS